MHVVTVNEVCDKTGCCMLDIVLPPVPVLFIVVPRPLAMVDSVAVMPAALTRENELAEGGASVV